MKSRRNALKHGLAGRGVVLPDGQHQAILDRAAEWHSSIRPVNVYEEWLLEAAATESLRYERCLAEEAALRGRLVERAETSWDEDRMTEAEHLARSLARDPALVVRKLRQSSQGAALLLGRLNRLAGFLADADRPWTEADEAEALDLLGIPEADRVEEAGAEVNDPARREDWAGLLAGEVAALEGWKAEVLDPRDEAERDDARANLFPEPPPELRRLHRYRREALRDLKAVVGQVRDRPARPMVSGGSGGASPGLRGGLGGTGGTPTPPRDLPGTRPRWPSAPAPASAVGAEQATGAPAATTPTPAPPTPVVAPPTPAPAPAPTVSPPAPATPPTVDDPEALRAEMRAALGDFLALPGDPSALPSLAAMLGPEGRARLRELTKGRDETKPMARYDDYAN